MSRLSHLFPLTALLLFLVSPSNGQDKYTDPVLNAKDSQHWSFQAPVRPKLPSLSNQVASENPIDAFIATRLQTAGLKPSPRQTVSTLIRRVTLDLIGLPPTFTEVDAFLRDNSPNAYEKVVDHFWPLLILANGGPSTGWTWSLCGLQRLRS